MLIDDVKGLLKGINKANAPKDDLSGRAFSLRRLRILRKRVDYRIFLGIIEILLWCFLLGIDILAAIVGSSQIKAYSLPITQTFIGIGALLLIARAIFALVQMGKIRIRIKHLAKRPRLYKGRSLGKL